MTLVLIILEIKFLYIFGYEKYIYNKIFFKIPVNIRAVYNLWEGCKLCLYVICLGINSFPSGECLVW